MYLAASQTNRKISNEVVLCFTTSVADHHSPSCSFRVKCCLNRFSHCANLVNLWYTVTKNELRHISFYINTRKEKALHIWIEILVINHVICTLISLQRREEEKVRGEGRSKERNIATCTIFSYPLISWWKEIFSTLSRRPIKKHHPLSNQTCWL